MTDRVSPSPLSRRLFLQGSALIGCSAAAWPLMSSITFAAAPTEQRLVVIILRGGLDGLDALRPAGDPGFAGLRSDDITGGDPGTALDTMFALHPALAPLLPLWQAGELGFAHAVATPYRDKRSHFDGQDILEAGTGLDVPDARVRDGWLNRMLQAVPGMSAETAYAVGRDELKVIAGDAGFKSWSPDSHLALSEQSLRLFERIYEADPLFHAASQEAIELSAGLGDDAMAGGGRDQPAQLAAFAAERLREEARIAAFSIGGWDTHRAQKRVLARRLEGLAEAILALRTGLAADWGRTTVLAMTEFGRTARENGTGGTDHGTGGVMLMAGGAIRGGRVFGRWPGLAEADLYGGRDLMPTADVRAYAGWAMRDLFGMERGLLESTVFPGLDMGENPGIIA